MSRLKDGINIAIDPCDPVEAYVRPIRSVLFIDDQFPTFDEVKDSDFTESRRARALWRACVDRGWLCDIDNSADWSEPVQQRRLAACDLLVLDFHLDGEDSKPALKIVRNLAKRLEPSIAVIYTQDSNLDRVLLQAASWARGVRSVDILEAFEELEGDIEWSTSDLFSFLSAGDYGGSWMDTLEAAFQREHLKTPSASDCEAFLEQSLQSQFGVEPEGDTRCLERISNKNERWLQCGNMFLAIINKPGMGESVGEADRLIGGLEAAIREWQPPWLACLIAMSRRDVEVGSFRDDAHVPEQDLQNGFLGHINSSDDAAEQRHRAHEIATHLLSRRFDNATKELGGRLLSRALEGEPPTLSENSIIHLNAFLCSEPFRHYHLRVGTVFATTEKPDEYWVCVTPACDMVPRESSSPWPASISPNKPLLALKLTPTTNKTDKRKALKTALRQATWGRNLFFWDKDRLENESPVVAACFKNSADPNPELEKMFAAEQALVDDDERVQICRVVLENEATKLAIKLIECRVVAQLRTPYAERLVQVVGSHVSRIGVDFVPLKKST